MNRKNYFYFFTLIPFFLFLFSYNVFSAVTALSGVTLSPANPSPGDLVTVNWNYTSDYGPEPEKYFIAVYNQCAIPATGAGNSAQMNMVIGDACAAPTPASNCLSCVSSSGCGDLPNPPAAGAHAAVKTITMPSNLIPGYTYYAIVAMGSYNVYLNPDLTASQQACVPFTCPLTPPYIKLNKVAEGTTGSIGTSVLFTIYYDAGNIHNFKITDAVDSRFTIIKVYSGGTAAGQNITWNVNAGYITSPQKGSVSFLAAINSGAAGAIIPNTAAGTCAEIASQNSNTASVAIGAPGLSIIKSASASTVNAGDTVTYFMQYINQGTTLVEYQNFDDGLIPAGWTNNPAGGAWNAAPGYLQQTVLGSGYTGYMDSAMTPIHDGIYICDMLIPSSNTAHLDGVMHFIQVDGSNFYMARINASDGKLYLDKVVAAAATIGGTSVANPHGIGIKQDTWYTLKVQVCGSSIMMKVWPKGDNEYPAWDLSVTDSSIPGMGIVGFQANEGPQQYDNLKVFSLTASTNPRIFDTVPAGISYSGCSGGTSCSKTGSVINWPVGSTCAGAQAVSWWGQVNESCGGAPITNAAGIDSDDSPPPVISNNVIVNVRACVPTATPTFTYSRTPSPTPSISPTFSQTYTRTVNNTPSFTATFSRTSSVTVTNTGTATLSVTPTNSPTATQTPVNTPTLTASRTNTSTASPTFSATNSPTQTWSQSATRTYTATPLPTASNTPSVTQTSMNTPTLTLTRTNTSTASPTVTITPSPSATVSATNTFTRTATPSVTATSTSTYTNTATYTLTVTDTISSNTPTFTLTSTRSSTATPTYTASSTMSYTSTYTASPTCSFTGTYTGTKTGSPTNTATPTDTVTLTATATITATDTMSSNTPTQTPTETQTFTATPTMTFTLSSTSTMTVTDVPATATFSATDTASSNTSTAVPTFTRTATESPTPVIPSATNTVTLTRTFTLLPTYTNTNTVSPTSTMAPTASQTPSGAPVDLAIKITASGDDPASGAVVKYSIHIRNDGAAGVSNIAVWDTLPANMTFISSVTPGTPAVAGQYLFWDAGSVTLAPGEEMTITFTAMITSVADGSLITTQAGTDYNDPFYSTPSYRHPPVFSAPHYYPEGDVRVFPNPYNIKNGAALKIINITPGSNVLIYTISGESVAAIYARSVKAEWDGKNRQGKACSAGVYYYAVVNQQTRATRTGKLFIVNQ